MTTKTRAKQCGRKIGHPNRQAAEEHRRRLIHEQGAAPGGLRAYTCPHCSR